MRASYGEKLELSIFNQPKVHLVFCQTSVDINLLSRAPSGRGHVRITDRQMDCLLWRALAYECDGLLTCWRLFKQRADRQFALFFFPPKRSQLVWTRTLFS